MSWFTSKKEKFVEVRSSFFRKLDDKKASTESAPVTEKDLQIPAPEPAPDAAAATPAVESAGHRTDRAADKLATALAAKYQFELNSSRSHKANVHALLSRELHDLTRQALAFRTARLPPRVLCRLNAFIANLCAAVPESPLPSALSRLSVSTRSADLPAWDDGEDNAMMLAQVSEEDLKKRLECYISALWATANAATQAELAKEAYKGNPKAAAAADREAAEALAAANERADSSRLEATVDSFVNVCVAQAALVPNMTLLQNIRPRHLLTPLVESLSREILGVPDVDSNTREKIAELVTTYERQHSFFQTAEANAKRVLVPALRELLVWLRQNEDSLVANSATEGMLAVIPDDLRHKLKTQVYYSADHFFEVFNELRPRLAKLPIPLHPLLEDTTMDAAQAMKDMHRERLTLNGPEVAPADIPRLLSDLIHGLLESSLALADGAAVAAREGSQGVNGQASQAANDVPTSPGSRNGTEGEVSTPPHASLTSPTLPTAPRHARAHVALSEHLVMRTINAASRTTSGGDAFFIVQDLYGGDGVLVKQSAVTAPPIEIIVDATGITVRSQDSYEIYHEQEVAEAEEAFPLMIMHTAMIENIPLPEPAIIRKYMSRRDLGFRGDMSRGADDSDVEALASLDPVVVRRFLSLDAVRPKRPR